MKDVSLFIPCIVDLLLPEVGEATVTVLQKLGLNPIYHPEQTCCGEPAINSGYQDHAVKAARHFIEIFENDEVIVCPAGSCVNTVKNHYPDILAGDSDWVKRAESVSSRVYELSQFIVDVMGIEVVDATYQGKVAFHRSCQQLRGLGISEQPEKLIRAVKGVEALPLVGADICCGFGGLFSVDYASISEAIVTNKTDNFINSGADVLVTCDPGCLTNINGYLSRSHPGKKAMHIATLLAGN